MPEPRIDDVAAAAGVHRSTVSRAFSKPEAVRPETREHVLKVAAELGYSMSPLAQALRRRVSNLVPLIVPDITNPFFAELAHTTAAAARRQGYQLILCLTDGDQSLTSKYLDSVHSMYSPFGIIAPSTPVDLESLRRDAFDNRVVVIDRVNSDYSVPTVTVDSAHGIDLAFEHLSSLGHTEIAYAPGIVGTNTAYDRRKAYQRAASMRDVKPQVLGSTHTADIGSEVVDDWLDSAQRPTAVIASNDAIAFAVIAEFSTRNIRVPEDVSVVGFDGLDLGAHFNPRLTSVKQPIEAMGEISIQLGEKLMNGETAEHIMLEPTLLVRSSTGEVTS
ncbi:LacI family DNA-binding transcriptional regulator [Rothia halotolerans]|uniref:LacI family DNA-binding transcriptional regulator n=1 Tax=Rothia halotolerans TaxID=405770 RepID=UPI00101DC7F4|nr:LacI family DNA-binding transcriptional regulator [Rothia halotolerans]